MQLSKDRFYFTTFEINENKDLSTTIGNKRYTLNDANELLNKIAKQKIGKNNAIKAYNNLVNKADQILNLRSTPPRQKILKTFNYSEEIFNGTTEGKGLKILTPNQMLSRLPITLAQLKAGNNSEKLENGIRQLLYSLYRWKKFTKQLYKSWHYLKMETIFMNTEKDKASKPHRFKLDLTDKLNLKNPSKNMTLALAVYYTWKNIKSKSITINIRFLHQHGMILLIYLMVLFYCSNSRLFWIYY